MLKTVKHYLVCSEAYSGELEFKYYPFDMTSVSEEFATVRVDNLEIDVPDGFDPRPGMIDALKKQQKKATADYQAQMTVLDGKIQKLRCIEMQPDLTYNETRGE